MVDALTTYTRAEVAQHNKKEDCWVIFDKKVYNITEFIEDHPGGEDVVLEYAGKDVTAIMKDSLSHVHSRSAYSMLIDFHIGSLAQSEIEKEDESQDGLPPPFLPADAHIADDFHPEETDMAKDFKHNKFLDLK